MREIKFRVWHRKEKKMYYRGYQKVSHVLLCEDDQGQNMGKGAPAKRASYEDCEFLENTTLEDKNGREIFEGDILCIRIGDEIFYGVVPQIPDMFKSRKLHPLDALLKKFCIGKDEPMEFEVLGNRHETPDLLAKFELS